MQGWGEGRGELKTKRRKGRTGGNRKGGRGGYANDNLPEGWKTIVGVKVFTKKLPRIQLEEGVH